MAEIEIEIDGQKLMAQSNQTVIQVADAAGIYIPRFCYHKNLSIPANCRMCLVEMEKSGKPVPACATPVAPGMKIYTKSQKAVLAQRAVMEFLLINHPLDCPICDQGGECELQDLSMGYGASSSDYNECKRAVADENLGPLISTEMTRCILCTRCIRFGDEVAGMRELGMTYRGEHEEVSTFVEHAMRSEVSGNIIDLCPVGALTSKPYRFTARAWELDQFPGVSPHDCLGSNLHIHTRYGKVMRVVSRENEEINQTWISDRDRFGYAGLYHEDRLEKPRVKVSGVWQTVDWQTAFDMAASQLQAVVKEYGAEQLGALISPNATLEEFYLLQKIMRGLGSNHVDHRLRESDTRDQQCMPGFPGINMPLPEIEQCDAILLIGSNLQKEQPLAALRVRKAIAHGATVAVVNPVDYDFNFAVHTKKIVAPSQMVAALTDMINHVDQSPLHGKQNPLILLGALAWHHPQASHIRFLAHKLADLCKARAGVMTSGANAAGAWLAGAIPHRQAAGVAVAQPGCSAYDMLQQPRKAMLLFNVEPDYDCANAHLATHALRKAACVIAVSQYHNPVLEEAANVIFPLSAFTETSGTYVNVTGEWQSVNGVSLPFGDSRPGWKILRVLGNFLQLNGFAYESSEEVKQEVHAQVKNMPTLRYTKKIGEEIEEEIVSPLPFTGEGSGVKVSRIGEIPLYALDPLVRRSEPLQAAQIIMEGEAIIAKMHSATAKQLGVCDGDEIRVKQSGSLALPVKIDDSIAEHAVWIAGGIAATRELGDLFGEIEIKK